MDERGTSDGVRAPGGASGKPARESGEGVAHRTGEAE